MEIIKLSFSKVLDAVAQKQIDAMCDFENLVGCPSTSQMLKRLDQETYAEIMRHLEEGAMVKITGN